MPKLTNRLPSFEGVAAGATATLRMPLGRTYERLNLSYSGVTLAQLKEIRLIGNGKTMMRWVGAELINVMNKFDRMEAAAGILVLNFVRHGMMTKIGIEETAIGTGVPANEKFPVTLSTLQLEVDIDPAATAPVLSATSIETAPQPLGMIRKIRTFNHSPTAAGEYEIANLPKGDLIARIIFKTSNLNSLRIERDNRVIFERTKAENELLQKNGKRTPQDGYFIYDPSEEGYATEALVTANVQDLRFILNMAAADNIQVTVEYLGYLER